MPQRHVTKTISFRSEALWKKAVHHAKEEMNRPLSTLISDLLIESMEKYKQRHSEDIIEEKISKLEDMVSELLKKEKRVN